MAVTGIEAKIADVLYARLGALVLAPVVPVAWPGLEFTPPATGGYLRAQIIEGTVEQVTFGDSGYNRHIGLLNVFVHWPLGLGEIPAKQVASAVAAHFKRGTSLGTAPVVRIIQPPVVGGSITERDWLIVPVATRWTSDNQPA